MSAVAPVSPPVCYAGRSWSSWLFALRIWVATMLALLAAFWLQIDGAASAAICVAILAQQRRGQAYQKAFYRLFGTVIGAGATVTITALFSQQRDLFVFAFAAWVALSVFVAGLLAGNRAYGAQLSGFTVAIVAVQLIDAPGQVFLATLSRCAAITLGIVAIALVNDLLAAPNVHASIFHRLLTIRQQVCAAARHWPDQRNAERDAEAARLLAAVAALHPDITAIPSEATVGGLGGAAASRAVVALVRAIFAFRADAGEVGTSSGVAIETEDGVSAALADLAAGLGQGRRVSLPIFRSREVAARNALRTFLVLIISSVLFGASGWPSTSLAFSLVAITMTLGSNAPDPKAFALGVAIGMPLAIAAVGVTEFLVLDGVAEFPLLAIAMAPPIAAACLMLASGKPPLARIGFPLLVFFPVFLSPSNPQSYNPQTYLLTATLALASLAVLVVGLTAILPADDQQKRRWLLGSARAELIGVLQGRRRRSGTDLVRDADRIAQAAALRIDPSRAVDLAILFWLAEMAELAGRLLDEVRVTRFAERIDVGRALRTLDAPLLRNCADRLAEPGHEDRQGLIPTLGRMAQLIEKRPSGAEALVREGQI